MFREPVTTELQRLAEHAVRSRNDKIKNSMSDKDKRASDKIAAKKVNKPDLSRNSEN